MTSLTAHLRLGDDFTRRVEEGFEEIARTEPDRVKVLDAALPPVELTQAVSRQILEQANR